MIYALIGSREAPRHVLMLMREIGKGLSDEGHFSYSGGAPGSDENWLMKYDKTLCCNIIPYMGFNNCYGNNNAVWNELSNDAKIRSFVHAKSVTSYWNELSLTVQTLFARNCMQVLGLECLQPVDEVLYWAREKCDGSVSGGTRVAVDIARKFGIKTTNLANKDTYNYYKDKYMYEFDIFSL